MLEKLKLALRIAHDKLDDDIRTNIKVCLADFKRVGISVPIDYEQDALIYKAIELYLKWQYNFQSLGDKYEIAYNNMRDAISLCGDYIDS